MRTLGFLLLATVVAGCGSLAVDEHGAPAADAGTLAATDAGSIPACMAGVPDADPLDPVWTYEPNDPNTKLAFNGVVDDHDDIYWAECNESCQLVSATRDGAIRFRADLGASFNNVAYAGGNVLVAAGCFVEAFSTAGQPRWMFDLRSGLGSTCQNAAVSFAELHDGAVLVVAQAGSARYAVRLDRAGLPTSWEGPVLTSSLWGGASAVAVASDGRGAVFQTQVTTSSGTISSGTTVATDESGNLLWQVPSGGDHVLTADGSVFAGSAELAAADGALIYAMSPLHLGDGDQRFLVAGDGVAVASQWPVEPCMYSPACTETDVFPIGSGLDDAIGLPDAISDVLLTSGNTALFVAWDDAFKPTALVAADASRRQFSCELSVGKPGPYPHYPMALLPNRLVVAQPDLSHPTMRIYAFDLPGLALAAHGWVTPQGNAGRSGRPQ